MGTIQIGATKYVGSKIQEAGGKLYIDGKLVEDARPNRDGILEIRIVEGTVENVTADGAVTAGSVKGSIKAGANVICDCVGGSVTANGNVNCGRVGGSVNAGKSARHA